MAHTPRPNSRTRPNTRIQLDKDPITIANQPQHRLWKSSLHGQECRTTPRHILKTSQLYATAARGAGNNHVIRMAMPRHWKLPRCCMVFASLHNILHKEVEQDTLSQVSMPLANMPTTLVFAHLDQDTGVMRCHKRPCLWRTCPTHW